MVQTLRPASTVTLDAGWSLVGAATAHAALSDDSDASYAQTATEGDVLEVALDPGAATTGLHRLWARTREFDTTGAGDASTLLDLSLIDGGAGTVATRQHTQVPGVGFAWYSWDLTAPEIALIADYADLRIRAVDAQTLFGFVHQLAETYLELGDPALASSSGERTVLQPGKRRALVQAEGVEP